jgi:site-specific recombinase XerD
MNVSEAYEPESQANLASIEPPSGPMVIALKLAKAAASAGAYAREARAQRTRTEYAKQWRAFSEWCDENGLCELPAAPQTLAMYLSARADEGRKVATLAQALAAISEAHIVAGHKTPRADRLVRETWKGVRRRLGVAADQKAPISAREIRAMIEELPPGLLGVRDRALITLGFAGGFRRSELVALDAIDLVFVDEGLEVLVRRSKTDQEGAGLTKVIAYGSDPATCPVRSVKDWLELSGIGEGSVFRGMNRHEHILDKRLTDHAVAVIVKRSAVKAGLNAERLSGHSLRAGFVTEAKKNGADDAAIMDQTGHKSLAMVQRYHRRTKKWEKPASARLGL